MVVIGGLVVFFSARNTRLDRASGDRIAFDGRPPHRVSEFARRCICDDLFKGKASAIQRARRYMRLNPRKSVTDREYFEILSNSTCAEFAIRSGYFTSPASREELNFPLAYGILVYENFEQFERLFRAIYALQNYYCIHVDRKSAAAFYNAVAKLTGCFENAYVVGTRVDVRWGEFSLLEAEVACARDLLKYKRWKYYINLTGHEFPLFSNRQLVRVFKAYNGSNDIDVQTEDIWKGRWTFRWYAAFNRTNELKEPVPYNLTTRKGELHVTASREFMEFALTDEKAQAFYYWLRDILIPDESFYTTLNFNSALCAPGSFAGWAKEKSAHYEARYKNWRTRQPEFMGGKPIQCQGRFRNDICIPGVGDLSKFAQPTNKKLFLNKLRQDFEYLTYDCLEDYHRNLTMRSTSNDFAFDDSFYRNLIFVKKKRDCRSRSYGVDYR
ncbi:N-acetyllactosaminide beta-1,6-N-acetylglucosaminyl-transferase-like [Tubulanus polymorphus]|uniref:N-acetyllactosaminide beta-1,6-N-acetylglucosaminyl-transferase-like n=1 Tax=Tubulanus polymorphus TaxID=672921 RepID=UPI003DA6C43D